MPRIEHVNLTVREIEPTKNFLLAAFPQWRVRAQGPNVWHGVTRNWIHIGDDDFYLSLYDGGTGPMRDLSSVTCGLAHIGLEVESIENLIANLKNAGFEVDHFGDEHPHRKNAYFMDPQGLEFEFVEYFTDIGSLKNQYC